MKRLGKKRDINRTLLGPWDRPVPLTATLPVEETGPFWKTSVVRERGVNRIYPVVVLVRPWLETTTP